MTDIVIIVLLILLLVLALFHARKHFKGAVAAAAEEAPSGTRKY